MPGVMFRARAGDVMDDDYYDDDPDDESDYLGGREPLTELERLEGTTTWVAAPASGDGSVLTLVVDCGGRIVGGSAVEIGAVRLGWPLIAARDTLHDDWTIEPLGEQMPPLSALGPDDDTGA